MCDPIGRDTFLQIFVPVLGRQLSLVRGQSVLNNYVSDSWVYYLFTSFRPRLRLVRTAYISSKSVQRYEWVQTNIQTHSKSIAFIT